MPSKTPDEIAVHLLLAGGHREEIRFASMADFQKWYSTVLVPKADTSAFVNVPMTLSEGEYLLVRPSQVLGVRVVPIYASSIDRSY
ncbi:MAG: hypothetical protein Fur0042_01980 [Cyanophyceae cyanobacterium]